MQNSTSNRLHHPGRPAKPLPLLIKPVAGRHGTDRFIKFPWSIYKDDPAWVPPLLFERRQHLSPKNPYFDHARFQSWLAYRGTVAVGRISAQIDRLHQERYHDHSGFFGLLEAEDNGETFAALLTTAENWLRSRGMQTCAGPFNLSINQECGLLAEGFDTPPSIMMGHAPPYYTDRVMEQGYRPIKELLAYSIETGFKPSRAMRAIIRRVNSHIRIRPMERGRYFDRELTVIGDIFNDAWHNNWGFIPFTTNELQAMGNDFKLLVDKDLIQIAEVDGMPAGMMVTLPNLNEIIADLNGRLLPFGWLKLLWRLKIRYPRTARVPLMGIRQQYHHTLMGAALAFMLIDSERQKVAKKGVEEVEMSWILEDNREMRKIIETHGGRITKRYRLYQKEL
ncbi:MAG: N-acetyltransferase [Deltaproteobacteria bacterium]|nr:N-acetyltransferase [Candidatus Anaeroferrophillus wilburensis]MBN2887721.1 N-acetyltransferase [Deltaproteobacteria bacterium]